jgi:two-component system sensor histidine kinase AlgZ
VETTLPPSWVATHIDRQLPERLCAVPDEIWKQSGLVVIIPAMLTTAYVSLLVDLQMELLDIAAIFCKLSVFYVCMILAVALANAFVPDDYRSGPRRSGMALVGIHTAVTLTGVAIGAEIAMELLWLVGGAESPGQGRALVYGLGFMIGFIVQSVTFLIDGMELRAQEGKMREELAKRDALQARLDALQARTHPHFLFNSLNVIAALIAVDAHRAEQAIETLSELMRYAIHSARERMVFLAAELEAVENYLSLERLRYGARLRVQIEIAPGLQDFEVPPLCLQPIVENAVLHGVSTREDGGALRIRATRQKDSLLFSIEDDGSGPGASSHTGTGTAMTDLRVRLELLYGGRAGLSVGEREGGGCRVELTIPITRDARVEA